jgi:hypothetical protein
MGVRKSDARPKIDTAQIEELDWNVLTSALLTAIERFYDDPANVARFNSWKKENGTKKEASHD